MLNPHSPSESRSCSHSPGDVCQGNIMDSLAGNPCEDRPGKIAFDYNLRRQEREGTPPKPAIGFSRSQSQPSEEHERSDGDARQSAVEEKPGLEDDQDETDEGWRKQKKVPGPPGSQDFGPSSGDDEDREIPEKVAGPEMNQVPCPKPPQLA